MSLAFLEHNRFIFQLTVEESEAIRRFALDRAFNPYIDETSLERFINKAYGITRYLPHELVAQLLMFRRKGNSDGVLIIRGFHIDDEEIGATLNHWSAVQQSKKTYLTEMYLLGVSLLLGEAFAFSTQHAGNIIQNVLPVKSDMYEQVGTGSKIFLEWHTEDAFHMMRPDFLGLLCLRGDTSAATTFASVRNMSIPDEFKRCLFEKRYQAGIDKAHGGSSRPEDGPEIAIFSGRYDDPQIRVDTSCIRALPGDLRAQEALDHLVGQMNATAQRFVLQAGDMLFIDNQHVVHGRTEFHPRFDGADRWLQRVIIASDLRKSSVARTHSFRTIQPGLEFIG